MGPTMPGINQHEWLNAFINASATIWEKAAVDIEEPQHKAVSYDPDGNVILADTGDTAIGLILSPHRDPIYAGAPVNILIKYIGLLTTSEELLKGDPITITTGGIAQKAVSGDFIFGWAFSHALPDETVHVQITKSGYMA